ncbi:MAG: alkaline phosphatase family protein [Candidatus Nanopelagicaceae bacterium]
MKLSEVTPAIFAGLGVAQYETRLGASISGREVLFLIDGFGAHALDDFPELIPNIVAGKSFGDVETAFPSTTSVSLATLMTGSMPNEHGMLGYTVRVPNSNGRVLNALKWDERVDPVHWQPKETLFEIGARHGISVTHVAAKRYEDTGFTRAVFRGAKYRGANLYPDLVTETITALKQTPAFVYLYVNDLDVAGHVAGYGSEKWLETLRMIDNLVGQLRERLPKGSRVWITGDHGMINADQKIVIGRDNLLMTEVSTIAGEPRARHIYLARPEITSEIVNLWRSQLGDFATIYSREEAISAGIFGSPMPTKFAERVGDLIAICNHEGILIDPAREKLESAMVGHHGGMTDIESSVPLMQLII